MRALAALSLVAAVAQAAPAVAQSQNCATLATQVEINACHGANYAFWQAELEKTYAEALGKIGAEDEVMMRAGQLAWVTYRDMTCEVEAGMMRGGSGEAMMRMGCLARLTEQRTAELQSFAGWFQ